MDENKVRRLVIAAGQGLVEEEVARTDLVRIYAASEAQRKSAVGAGNDPHRPSTPLPPGIHD